LADRKEAVALELKMRISLGIGVDEGPTFQTWMDRLEQHAKALAAGQEALSFLQDDDRLRKARVLVEDGSYIAEVEVPQRDRQIPLLPPGRRPRRAANLREEEPAVDQELVRGIISSLEASQEASQKFADLANSVPAEDLPIAVKSLERELAVDSAPVLRDIAMRKEPLKFELVGQGEFAFPAPPAVRKTVVSEKSVALYLRPSISKANLDLPATVKQKSAEGEPPPEGPPADQRTLDCFNVERSYEFRFDGGTPAQRALISAAWALGLDLGVLARYATSTSTLKAAPAEVDEVLAWSRLTQQVVDAMVAAASDPYRRPAPSARDADGRQSDES
jgi:hypothetical protein